ncbi:MAG: CsbD family protein [Acidobacteriota bacterium]|nr:CsbD family protein [Acidobacteriota bacterium]
MPNNDEIKGKFDQVKGKVKQEIGDATGDQDLHDEGVVDQASGEIQEGFGTAKRKVGEAVKDLGDRIKQ